MNGILRFIGLGIVATTVTTVTAIGVYAASQNTSANPASFSAQGRGGRGFGGPGRAGGPGGPMGPGGPIDLPIERLGLSDAQKDQVKAILQSHQDELKALGDRAMTARRALEAAIDAETVDDSAIRTASADVAAVDADMAVARAHIRAEVFQVLTPDQQARARQLQAAMSKRMNRSR